MFAALSIVAVAIGIGFAIAGAWLILPFAGLEVVMLGVAFVLYARRAADYEKIELARERLTVEVGQAARTARYEFDPRRAAVRLEKNEGYGARVLLRGAEEELEVGRHLDALARVEFAAELRRKIEDLTRGRT